MTTKVHGPICRSAIWIIISVIVFLGALGITDVSYAASKPAAPKMKTLKVYYESNGTCSASLTWKAKKKATYQILRKTSGGKYKVVGQKKTTSKSGWYVDHNLKPNLSYVYSVRQIKIKKKSKKKTYGKYDTKGLPALKQPKTTVDFQNLKAVVRWNKVPGAQKYIIYRKVGRGGAWKKLGEVKKNTTAWTDTYYSSRTSALMPYFTSTVFLDPSNNPTSYAVRAWSQTKFKRTKKVSWGLYPRSGVFHLEPPAITSLSGSGSSGTLRWGTVPMADGYSILHRTPSGGWSELKRVSAVGGTYQSASVSGNIANDYYAVRSFAKTESGFQYSGYDTGFTLRNRRYGSKKILFLGDSITFGSPYYGSEVKSFSYPNRIQQLTGAQMFNPSIPGSTWHFDEAADRYRIANGVAGMVAEGQNTDNAFGSLCVGSNSSRIEDYDVVVLAAGTNDYNDKYYKKPVFGDRNNDWTNSSVKAGRTQNLRFTVNRGTSHAKTYTRSYDYNIRTFDGAYNQVYKYIEEASLKRVMEGKPAIKVVSLGLFYSDRTSPYRLRTNRNVKKNWYGYTLMDYQREQDAMNAAWAKSPVLDVYYYNTQSYNIVNQNNCPYLASDNLHFSKYAYGLYGNSISSFLVSNVLGSRAKAVDLNSSAMKNLMSRYGIEKEQAEAIEPLPEQSQDGQGAADGIQKAPASDDAVQSAPVDTEPISNGDGPIDTMNEAEAAQADKEAASQMQPDPDAIDPNEPEGAHLKKQ